MSLHKLEAIVNALQGKEKTHMELLAALPEWLVWCAAGAAGALALAAVARILQVALDVDAG